MVLLVSVVISRIIIFREAKKLTAEQKAQMVDKFAGFSAYGLIPVVVLIGVYFLALKYTDFDPTVILWIYLSVLVVTIKGFQVYILRKLKELDLGRSYMRRFIFARVISWIGFATFFTAIVPV